MQLKLLVQVKLRERKMNNFIGPKNPIPDEYDDDWTQDEEN